MCNIAVIADGMVLYSIILAVSPGEKGKNQNTFTHLEYLYLQYAEYYYCLLLSDCAVSVDLLSTQSLVWVADNNLNLTLMITVLTLYYSTLPIRQCE